MSTIKQQLSHFLYKLLVKTTSEEWVAYYIFKSEPATLKGLKECIAILKKQGKQPKPEYLNLLKEKQKLWDDFLKKASENKK